MKKKLLILFVQLFIYNCFGQKTNHIEVYKIINVTIESLNENKIYLYDSISTSSYNFWINTLTDSNVLKGTDSLIVKLYLAKPGVKQFFEPKLIQFYENHLIKIKLNTDYLSKKKVILFKSKRNEVFPKYFISYPILSLNKKYAWIMISKHINNNSGYLKIILLKKENGIWKYFSTIDKKAPAVVCPAIDKKTIQMIERKKE